MEATFYLSRLIKYNSLFTSSPPRATPDNMMGHYVASGPRGDGLVLNGDMIKKGCR